MRRLGFCAAAEENSLSDATGANRTNLWLFGCEAAIRDMIEPILEAEDVMFYIACR